MLGTVARDHVVKLAQLMIEAVAPDVIRWAQELEQWAPDHAQLLDEFAALLVRVALLQAVPDYGGDELYELGLLQELAQGLRPDDVQLYYQTAIIGRRDLHLAPDPRAGFEMTLLRMLGFRYAGSGLAATPPAQVRPAAPWRPRPPPAGGQPIGPLCGPSGCQRARGGRLDGHGRGDGPERCRTISGPELPVPGATGRRRAAGPGSALPGLANSGGRGQAAAGAGGLFREPVRLEFVADAQAQTPAQIQDREGREALVAARQAFGEDPTVKALQERFGATLLPDTIRPTRTDS